MSKIFGFLRDYWKHQHKGVFAVAAAITALAVFINYRYHLSAALYDLPRFQSYLGWYLLFLVVFASGYLLNFARQPRPKLTAAFYFLLLLAPALFSWKMVFDLSLPISSHEAQNTYWNRVLYWPFKLIIITGVLFVVWRATGDRGSFYGVTAKGFKSGPYLLMLAIMVPLVAAASTQPDFLHTYPKLKNIAFVEDHPHALWYGLVYELSYGSDFFTIELFFRGFLVLAFVKWFGRDAILPMAMFYCTIHFGKPLGECISSFFGGLILGIVTYHTRTILGGLMVHLGIAWMMELGGYLGSS